MDIIDKLKAYLMFSNYLDIFNSKKWFNYIILLSTHFLKSSCFSSGIEGVFICRLIIRQTSGCLRSNVFSLVIFGMTSSVVQWAWGYSWCSISNQRSDLNQGWSLISRIWLLNPKRLSGWKVKERFIIITKHPKSKSLNLLTCFSTILF